jgi:hypothetical protein
MVSELFKRFNCDRTYIFFCKRQQCFRARLSPKPSYIKTKGIKLKFPLNEEQNSQLDNWLKDYEATSEEYATCRFKIELGDYSGREHSTIREHDSYTKAHSGLPLG